MPTSARSTVPAEGAPGHVAEQLRDQAASCAAMGSALYAHLLCAAAADVEADGPCWAVLAAHVLPGRGDALALRFMAAMHRLVLTRRAAELAVHYPSVSGTAADLDAARAAFLATVERHAATLRGLVVLPCQTNEVGRAAGLVGGFLTVARDTGLPLRLLEVGASAGLNLRWDRFRYGGGGAAWGRPDSPVDLGGLWRVPPPTDPAAVEVVERSGCDRQPVDPATAEGRLALTASVWADQTARFARLKGALRLATEVPATVDAAPLDDWIAAQLARPTPGAATVVYHSVVDEYLPDEVRARFHAALAAAGEQATPDAPLAWLRLEPVDRLRSHGVVLSTWSGPAPALTRTLARCGAHGTDVEWLASDRLGGP